MAVLSVLSVTTSFVSCPLPLLYSSSPTLPLKFYVFVIYKALGFDVAQGRMNGASNETRTHSCRFAQASQAVTDFTTELAQPFSFAYSDIIWVQDRLLLKPARDRHNFPHMSQLAW